jgi:flagellin-like protein
LRLLRRGKRAGLSEITGTLIMIAVTLIAGAAVFGWVNGQAGNSETAYGTSVANNVNFLNEKFVEVAQTFTGTGVGGVCSGGTSPNFRCTGANFWMYNNGRVSLTIYSIQIKNLTDIPGSALNPNPLNIRFYADASGCPSSSCGFIAYNKAGTSTLCSSTTGANGITYSGGVVPTLSTSTLSSSAYAITMPTGVTCSAGAQYLYDGIAYTFTFTGLYGNTYSSTITVNG